MTSSEPKICIFCGKDADTRDHIPPKCIFPDPKPNDLITVPACKACNSNTKLDDEYFRWLVATASEDSDGALKIITNKILPKVKKRPAFLVQIMNNSRHVETYSESGIYLGNKPAFYIEKKRVQTVINKIVRGLYYKETKSMLPLDSLISNFSLNPKLDEPEKYVGSLPFYSIGNGTFSYRYWLNEFNTQESVWFIMFFDRTLFVISTLQNANYTPDGLLHLPQKQP